MKTPHRCGFTRFELVFALAVFGTLCTLLFSACSDEQQRRRVAMIEQLSNAKHIAVGLKLYASDNDGTFPAYDDPDGAKTIFQSSNAALGSLLKTYGVVKVLFFNKYSAWCKAQKAPAADDRFKLLPGECDWAYVRGLTETMQGDFPLLANAFAPGTHTYVAAGAKQGGVWDGRDALVGYVDCSVRVVPTKKKGETFYIPRRDKPEANAFDAEAEWLEGEKVEVLLPLPPKD